MSEVDEEATQDWVCRHLADRGDCWMCEEERQVKWVRRARGVIAKLWLRRQGVDVEALIERVAEQELTGVHRENGAVALRERLRTARAEVEALQASRRGVAQSLVAAIGAPGPESLEETARRAVEQLEALRSMLNEAKDLLLESAPRDPTDMDWKPKVRALLDRIDPMRVKKASTHG